MIFASSSACSPDRIAVRNGQATRSDGERSALLEAITLASSRPSDPAAYRQFAEKVARLATEAHESVAEEAARSLVFLALPVLEHNFDRPLAEQAEALATTVWPTALGVEPRPGEGARDYLERICREHRPNDCKFVVPEYRPLIVSAMVWSGLRDRARQAYKSCDSCRDDSRYGQALTMFVDRARHIRDRADASADDAKPRAWPTAGDQASDWSGAPLLVRKGDGSAVFAGAAIPGSQWRDALAARRRGKRLLGVHLRPEDKVATLRAIAEDARAAGFTELALQVRGRQFPFALGEYRIVLPNRGARQGVRSLAMRDLDTVQMAVQALDAARGRGAGPTRL